MLSWPPSTVTSLLGSCYSVVTRYAGRMDARYLPYWYLLLGLALLAYGWSVAGAQPLSCGQPEGYAVWSLVSASEVTAARSWQVSAPAAGSVWLAHQIGPGRSQAYVSLTRAGNVALYNGWGVASVQAPDWQPVGVVGQVSLTEVLTVQVGTSGVGWCLALPAPAPTPTPVVTPTPGPELPGQLDSLVAYQRVVAGVVLYVAALWLLFRVYAGR